MHLNCYQPAQQQRLTTSFTLRPRHRQQYQSVRVEASPGSTEQQPTQTAKTPNAAPQAAPNAAKAQGQPMQRRPMPPAAPVMPPGFKVERVENLNEDVWEGAGVAAVDRGEGANGNAWGRVALLVGGDVAALLLFAAVGRASHGESLVLGELLGTAWPFIAGVLLTSPLSGAYGKDAQSGVVSKSALPALKTWGLGIPAGLLLRIISKGYVPDKAFLIVALAANLVLLLGWRSAAGAALPEVKAPAAGAAGRKDKKGNPMEFLQLISGLVKRW